jgi:alkanesulfonate monooxygenase SsuD/methylene tetrahydromethanopterin reductase-like flavin-dependent oxidoreductase (luciferase family)
MTSLFFGSQVNNGATWQQLLDVAHAMDAGRWRSLWVFDHFVPPLAGADEALDCSEGWSLLGGLAVATSRVRLGSLVTGNTYRNPALLAKMAATVDQMSGGRLEFAIGAGWHQREHEAYGWDFPVHQGALRPAGGGVRRHQRAFHKQWAGLVHRPLLSSGQRAVRPEVRPGAACAHHDRRWRREANTADARPLR